MKKLAEEILNGARALPVLSFPSAALMGITVKQLISDAGNQARGMRCIKERFPVAASLNMMDLSVEAEAFGAEILFPENEIPTVSRGILSDIAEARLLAVPQVGAGRTGVYVDGVKRAKEQIKDIPVLCGVIGPYSLAGRLFDMTELMMACFDSPDDVKLLCEKCAEFITRYILAFKVAGADGVLMAEPAAGILSPDMCSEFSTPFVKKIADAVSDDNFLFGYHNCGGGVLGMAEDISSIGADLYHFGNAINLADIIPLMPEQSIVAGNLDPLLLRGTPDAVKAEKQRIISACSGYGNFVFSSGCDIPFDAKPECLDAFFE